MDFFIASITLISLRPNVSSQDIECPGMTIPYRCSVVSNSETVQLTWLASFPGGEEVTISYVDDSTLTMTQDLGLGITSVLTQYTRDVFIESEITLTVLQNSMNGTVLECSTENLAEELVTVYVNISLGEFFVVFASITSYHLFQFQILPLI